MKTDQRCLIAILPEPTLAKTESVLNKAKRAVEIVQLSGLEEINSKQLDCEPEALLVDFAAVSLPPKIFLQSALELFPLIPVIVLDGTNSADLAVHCLDAGAYDVIFQDQLFRLPYMLENASHWRAERENRFDAERLFSSFMDQLDVSIFIRDENNVLRYANQFMVERFGADDWINKTPFQHLPEEIAQRIYDEDMSVLQHGPLQGETRRTDVDGQIRFYQTLKFPIHRDQGSSWVGGIAFDITPLKVAQERLELEQESLSELVAERTQALKHSNRELVRASKLKDEFLAGVSHELRTPLNNILLSAEMLISGIYGQLVGKQAKAVKNIEMGGRHLLDLINDILDLASIESGQVELEKEYVDVERLVNNSRSLVVETAHKKQVHVATSIAPGIDTVFGDRRRLLQILINLLGNAVKFTPNGGAVELNVSADVETQSIVFAVQDNGVGIEPDRIEEMFQPFTRNDNAQTLSEEGTGLGLSLVQKLVDLHDGGISVESRVGVGSCFTVKIPAAEFDTEALIRSARVPEELRHQYERATILIAEDNPISRSLMADFCGATGCEVLTAKDGLDALEKIRTHRPDAVVMDIELPRLDGLSILHMVRADGDADIAQTPMVVYTSLAMQDDEDRCLAAGANAYFRKPVKLTEMKSTVMALAVQCGKQRVAD